MTPREMLQRVSSPELTELMAFFELEAKQPAPPGVKVPIPEDRDVHAIKASFRAFADRRNRSKR